ncbi:MarR family winged helix-turn-helix transcriptional regulator [Dactylosporangium sp. NBC_01737]|uniref:MarR family winged helix-turn-helix transcriptional regulator n=1 Tax=Dactylosporangium sp. NBC_01737 TaxID=2975959 RepID=UPI002E13D9A6|nr:MarR family winged helix-turn-helix transcriptional regulator [Dactylosporangium sp. NBC_01737]
MDHRQLFDDLVRFETDLWNGVDATLRQSCDLPLGSFNVMLVIERTPACRVNDIAEQLSITIGGASQAVDRLQARGLCERRANPADRRSSVVALTGAGAAALQLAGPVFDAELARWFETEDIGQFAEVLRTLRGHRHA